MHFTTSELNIILACLESRAMTGEAGLRARIRLAIAKAEVAAKEVK